MAVCAPVIPALVGAGDTGAETGESLGLAGCQPSWGRGNLEFLSQMNEVESDKEE